MIGIAQVAVGTASLSTEFLPDLGFTLATEGLIDLYTACKMKKG